MKREAEVRAALITGGCSLLSAIISGIFCYFEGLNNAENRGDQNVNQVVEVNVGENQKKDQEIQNLNNVIEEEQQNNESLQDAISSLELAYAGLESENAEYEKENETLRNDISEYQKENESLRHDISQYEQENESLGNRVDEYEKMQEQYEGSQDSHDEVGTNQEGNNQSDAIPVLKAHEWKNKSVYEEFSGNENTGFNMYGETYTNGFTISMGASYNMWGNGEQYVVYNISDISDKYSTLKLLVGHVDGYESKKVVVRIYLDKTLDDDPDYEYTVSPEIPPQEISISVRGKAGMVIEVENLGGSDNKVGFANPQYE